MLISPDKEAELKVMQAGVSGEDRGNVGVINIQLDESLPDFLNQNMNLRLGKAEQLALMPFNYRTVNGESLLHFAARYGQMHIVQYLLKATVTFINGVIYRYPMIHPLLATYPNQEEGLVAETPAAYAQRLSDENDVQVAEVVQYLVNLTKEKLPERKPSAERDAKSVSALIESKKSESSSPKENKSVTLILKFLHKKPSVKELDSITGKAQFRLLSKPFMEKEWQAVMKGLLAEGASADDIRVIYVNEKILKSQSKLEPSKPKK